MYVHTNNTSFEKRIQYICMTLYVRACIEQSSFQNVVTLLDLLTSESGLNKHWTTQACVKQMKLVQRALYFFLMSLFSSCM